MRFPELAMEKYDFSLPGHDDAAVRKVYQDSKGFLWIFTGLPGIIRLDPETGVKQYCCNQVGLFDYQQIG